MLKYFCTHQKFLRNLRTSCACSGLNLMFYHYKALKINDMCDFLNAI